MVNGVTGVSAGMTVEQIKTLVQEAVAEALETQNKQDVETETQDTETGLEENADTNINSQNNSTSNENSLTGYNAFLTTITTMFTSMMQMMMKLVEGTKTEEAPKEEETKQEPHIYTKEEQEFLETYENFLRIKVAEEKLTTDHDVAQSLLGSDSSWNTKLVIVSKTVTQEEIDDYLSRNPDAIQNGILESKSWTHSDKVINKKKVK